MIADGVPLSLWIRNPVAWLVAAAVSDEAFETVQWFLGTPIGLLLLLGCTIALFFHFFAGIRHLVWDAGYGFDLRAIYASGYAVVVTSTALTVAAWIASIIWVG